MRITKDRYQERNRMYRQATTSRERCLQIMESANLVPCAILVMAFFLPVQGHCDSEITAIEALTDSTIQTIFSPWIRKAALAFGAGLGLFQSYMAGSIKPLITWGGLGLAVNYIPKVIEVIAKVGV